MSARASAFMWASTSSRLRRRVGSLSSESRCSTSFQVLFGSSFMVPVSLIGSLWIVVLPHALAQGQDRPRPRLPSRDSGRFEVLDSHLVLEPAIGLEVSGKEEGRAAVRLAVVAVAGRLTPGVERELAEHPVVVVAVALLLHVDRAQSRLLLRLEQADDRGDVLLDGHEVGDVQDEAVRADGEEVVREM